MSSGALTGQETSGPRRRVVGYRALFAIWATVIAIILGTGGGALWHLHAAALAAAQRDMTTLSAALAAQTAGALDAADRQLQEIASLAASDAPTPAAFRERASDPAQHDFLASRLLNLPQLQAFVVLGADGALLNSSRSDERFDVASLRPARADARDTVLLGAPTPDADSGRPVVPIARRITAADGTPLGLVAGLVNTDYLRGLQRPFETAAGRSVRLLADNGSLIVGGAEPATPVQAAQRVPGYRITLQVAEPKDAALAGWRGEMIALVAARCGAAVVFSGLFVVIAVQFRRQQVYASALARSAELLRAGERQVRDFAEISSDWFWEQGADGRINWLSSAALKKLPTGRRYIGATRWELADQGGSEPHWQAHQADIAARRPFRDFRYQIRGTDGAVHHVSTSGLAVFDDRGKFLGYRGTAREVTAEVAVADELRRSKDAAEAANRAKSEFLANMSHELRTPLNAIIGFSELMQNQRPGRGGDEYVGWARDILASGRHLLDVINDVLHLARIEAGRYALADDRVDLAIAVRACIGMVRLQAETKHVVVSSSIAERAAVLRADSRAIKQIVLNLLTNAVKFTPDGGSVSISVEPDAGGGLRLMVADTGIGIDPAAMASLCEPFTQADASISRTYGGTGLGLSICRKLVALHDGELTLASLPGEGTKVQVTFPANRVQTRTSPTLAAAE